METELAPNSARTYRLAPEGLTAARKKLLLQRVVIFAGITIFLLALEYKEFGDSLREKSIIGLLPPSFLILAIFIALVVGMKRGTEQAQESWYSHELVIGEDFLIKRIKGFPEIEIQRHEVTAIKESPAGLSVETNVKNIWLDLQFINTARFRQK